MFYIFIHIDRLYKVGLSFGSLVTVDNYTSFVDPSVSSLKSDILREEKARSTGNGADNCTFFISNPAFDLLGKLLKNCLKSREYLPVSLP